MAETPFVMDRRTDGQTDGRMMRFLYASRSSFGGTKITIFKYQLVTDRRNDGRTDRPDGGAVQFLYAFRSSFGGIKITILKYQLELLLRHDFDL